MTNASLLSVEGGAVSYDGTHVGEFQSVLDDAVSYSDKVEYLDDNTSLEKALVTLDTWTASELVYDNGLYITHYDYIINDTERPVSDACNIGPQPIINR